MENAFCSEVGAINWCNELIMMVPCGNSSHMIAGFAAGKGIPITIICDDTSVINKPELMYKFASKICRLSEFVKETINYNSLSDLVIRFSSYAPKHDIAYAAVLITDWLFEISGMSKDYAGNIAFRVLFESKAWVNSKNFDILSEHLAGLKLMTFNKSHDFVVDCIVDVAESIIHDNHQYKNLISRILENVYRYFAFNEMIYASYAKEFDSFRIELILNSGFVDFANVGDIKY